MHPVCGNCHRHRLPCVYDRVRQPESEASRTSEASAEPSSTYQSPEAGSVRSNDSRGSPIPAEYPESRERRLLELRLINHFVAAAGPTLGADAAASDAFTKLAPNLAFTNDALLYAILSVSAFHAGKCDPSNPEYVDSYRLYYGLAVIEHRKDVMRGMSYDTVNVLILTSTFLRVATFVEIQERPMDPYEPPYQFLQMLNSAGLVFREGWNYGGEDENSLISRLVNRVPVVKDESQLYHRDHRMGLLHLLRRTPMDEGEEVWTEEIQDTYETTLSGTYSCGSA